MAIIALKKADLGTVVAATGTPFFYPRGSMSGKCANDRLISEPSIFRAINGFSKYSPNRVDGSITINSTMLFFTGYPNSPSGSNMLDLFTVALHEAMHILVFHPIIDRGTTNLDIPYTDYDLLIKKTGQHLLINNCSSPCYHNNYNPQTIQSCEVVVGNNNIEVASTTDFAHLAGTDQVCGSDYVMNPGLSREVRKLLSQDEITLLCDLGYTIRNGCDGKYGLPSEPHGFVTQLCSDHEFCCRNEFTSCSNSIIIQKEELLCFGNTNDLASFQIVNIIPRFTNGINIILNQNSITINRTSGSYDISVYVIYSFIKPDGTCFNTYKEINLLFDPTCPNSCEYSENLECSNLFCYSNFDNLPEIGAMNLGSSFVFENECNNSPQIEPSPFSLPGKCVLLAFDEESVYFEILGGPYLNCDLDFSFDAATDIGGRTISIWGSEYPPCNIEDRSIPPLCGIGDVPCDGYVFNPICLGSFNINNTTQFNKFSLLINQQVLSTNINYILFKASNRVFLDNINIKVRNCANSSDFEIFHVNCNTIDFTPIDLSNHASVFWNFGDGQTSIETRPSHVYLLNGNFTITLVVTDNCGNTSSKQKLIEVNCVEITYEQLSCGTYKFTPIPNDIALYSYSWHFETYPGALSTLPNPEYSYHENGDYIVTLVVTNLSTNVSTTITKTIAVKCFDDERRCLPLDYVAEEYIEISGLSGSDGQGENHHGPFLWSVFAAQNGFNPNIVKYKKFLVRGTLIIDIPTTFTSCNWVMDAGSSMRIDFNPSIGSSTVYINGGSLRGCDLMWAGIECPSRTINMQGVTIRDAENALNLTGSGRAYLSNNYFYDNVYNVKAVNNANPITFCRGNHFKKDIGMKLPFPGQIHWDSEKPIYGIFASGCNSVNINGVSNTLKNYFVDMRNGIYVSNGMANVIYNDFANITHSAIGIDGNIGSSTISYNKIDYSGSGVNIGNAKPNSALIINNNFEIKNSFYGIYVNGGSDYSINIHGNHLIKNNNIGINISNILLPKRISIVDNIGPVIEPCFQLNKTSISIFRVSGLYQCEILRNKIRTHDYGQSIGIKMANCSYGWDIIDNDIIIGQTTNSTSIASDGIVITNSPSNVFKNNYVQGAGVSRNYYFVASAANYYECNIANYGRTGFQFDNLNVATDFNTNQIKNITLNGLWIRNSVLNGILVPGQIGAQAYKGNTWYNNNGFQSSSRLDLGSPITENQFIYNPSTTNPEPPIPGAAWKSTLTLQGNNPIIGWFLAQQDENNSSCTDPCCEPPSSTSEISLPVLEGAVQGTLILNDYANQNTWTGQWQVLQILEQYPSLLSESTLLNNFYYSDPVVKSYYNIEKAISNIYSFNTTASAQLSVYDDQISSLHQQLELLVSDSLSNNPNYDINIKNKMEEIQLVHNSIIAINETLENETINTANSIKISLGSLPTPFPFCDYYKTTYNAILDLIIQGEAFVSSTYGNDLQAIAEECIFEIGNPIFLGQGLCSNLGLTFNANVECTENRSRITIKEGQKSNLTITPNPSSSRIEVRSMIAFQSVLILNSDGRVVKENKLQEAVSVITIDIDQLKSGLYFIETIDSNGNRLIDRFIKLQ